MFAMIHSQLLMEAIVARKSGRAALVLTQAQTATLKEAMAEFAAKSLVLPLTVVSDGLNCFTVAQGIGALHKRTLTGGGKGSVKLPQFQAINIVLGNLKTALCGAYHAFDFAKYAHRYFAEAQYRFNRRFDLRSILQRLVRAAAATLPRPAAVIRGAEGCQ